MLAFLMEAFPFLTNTYIVPHKKLGMQLLGVVFWEKTFLDTNPHQGKPLKQHTVNPCNPHGGIQGEAVKDQFKNSSTEYTQRMCNGDTSSIPNHPLGTKKPLAPRHWETKGHSS